MAIACAPYAGKKRDGGNQIKKMLEPYERWLKKQGHTKKAKADPEGLARALANMD